MCDIVVKRVSTEREDRHSKEGRKEQPCRGHGPQLVVLDVATTTHGQQLLLVGDDYEDNLGW